MVDVTIYLLVLDINEDAGLSSVEFEVVDDEELDLILFDVDDDDVDFGPVVFSIGGNRWDTVVVDGGVD